MKPTLTRKGFELFFDRLKAREALIESRKSHTVLCQKDQSMTIQTKTAECPKTKRTNETSK